MDKETPEQFVENAKGSCMHYFKQLFPDIDQRYAIELYLKKFKIRTICTANMDFGDHSSLYNGMCSSRTEKSLRKEFYEELEFIGEHRFDDLRKDIIEKENLMNLIIKTYSIQMYLDIIESINNNTFLFPKEIDSELSNRIMNVLVEPWKLSAS